MLLVEVDFVLQVVNHFLVYNVGALAVGVGHGWFGGASGLLRSLLEDERVVQIESNIGQRLIWMD